MPKDFLYCEETDTKIYPGDVVTISSFPDVKFIAKSGWHKSDGAQKNGWYFVNIQDKSIVTIDQVDIKDIHNETRQGVSVESRSEPKAIEGQPKVSDYLTIPDTDINLYSNDIVTISGYPDNYVIKYGWYRLNTAQKNGWYLVNVTDRSIIPIDDVDLSKVNKEVYIGSSELKPTLKDIDTTPAESKYLVIPGTDIRIYDGDIVKISNKPRLKWIVHSGWYIYDSVQHFGWYFVSIKDGAILPASVVDLTLCHIVTLKTQGSEICDGKVVNYTRPFTLADAEILNRSFITLDSLEQRDNLDKKKLINGKMVRVNNVEGPASYYAWNAETQSWEFLEVFGIPELVGTTENPIILSELGPALYRVKGTYKISPAHPTAYLTPIDHLAFVSGDDEINIKVITEHNITDYIVEGDDVTFINNYATVQYVEQNYATKVYVDNKIAVLEGQISEIISEFPEKVRAIVYDVLGEALNGIEEEYIDNLFN